MKKFMIGIALFAIAGAASAGMIAEWTSEADPSNDATFAATATDPAVSTAGMERGNLDDPNQKDRSRGFTIYATSGTVAGGGPGPRTYEEAVATNAYLSWTIDLSGANTMSITNVYVDIDDFGKRQGMEMRSSADNYAAALFTDPGYGYHGSVDLSSNANFENLETIEFRLYCWQNKETDKWSQYTGAKLNEAEGVDFQVNGVIPEPATVGMLGLGALVALLVRRVRA